MAKKINVTTAKPKVGGAVAVAPIGTTLPTDAVTTVDVAFKSLGYISEDGLKNNGEISIESIKAWGGDKVLDAQSEKIDEFSATFIEALNVDLLKFVHVAENVTGTIDEGIAIEVNAKEHEEQAIVVDMVLNKTTVKRIVIPAGKVTKVDEVEYTDSNAVGYAVTISAYPDENGNTHYEYIKSTTV